MTQPNERTSADRSNAWRWVGVGTGAGILAGVIVGSVMCAGGGRGMRRVDDEGLRYIAEAGMVSNRWIARYDGKGRRTAVVAPGHVADFRDLLLTLVPVQSLGPSPMRFPMFEIGYHSGNSPQIVLVRPRPDALEFEIEGQVYIGGDSLAFMRQVQSMLASGTASK